MTGNWYDSVGSGIGSLVDMFAGNPHGMTAAGASAATPMLTEHAQHVAGSTDFGKATGLTPFMKMLGIGGPAATPAASSAAPGESETLS